LPVADENNKIARENLLPGTTDWLIKVKYDTCSLPDHRFCRRPQIEDTVQKQVSEKEIRLISMSVPTLRQPLRLISTAWGTTEEKAEPSKSMSDPLKGREQSSPNPDPKTNFFECNWDRTYQLVILPTG
jgi:hypothetical protein